MGRNHQLDKLSGATIQGFAEQKQRRSLQSFCDLTSLVRPRMAKNDGFFGGGHAGETCFFFKNLLLIHKCKVEKYDPRLLI